MSSPNSPAYQRIASFLQNSFGRAGSTAHSSAKAMDPGQIRGHLPRATDINKLSNNRRDLEALINYHLGEMARLEEVIVRLREDAIFGEYKMLGAQHQSAEPGMENSIIVADAKVRTAYEARDSYGLFIIFHRDELIVLGEKMRQLKAEAGEVAFVPEVIQNMLKDWKHWEEVFHTGIGGNEREGRWGREQGVSSRVHH